MKDIYSILKDHWGYNSYRPMQEEIIQSVLKGKDTLAVLPTGGGKSICFQVPALASEGLCIVVSPLIALMKDQVDHLRKRNIPALLIHSGMKKADVVQTLKNATHDYFKFLYVSPERLETSLFLEYLPGLHVNLIAVDEAHCISQWGYDFRPSYLRIAALRKEIPGVPVLALTASATTEVQNDICNKLEFPSPLIFRQSFERSNLSYSAFKVDSKLSRLADIIKKVPGTAIVYCKSRKRTVEIMNLLQMHGLAASNYHAGLLQEERNTRQKDWIENRIQVIVCTNAFGMGIDKPDVRLVIHADIPECLENYYQEAGRAGRDGKKSFAVLLYDESDLDELSHAHNIRFPSPSQIKKVYNALVNFLQIPANTGAASAFEFDLESFARNFKLNTREALYALKALEQDGWIFFNERNFSSSTVVFTTSRNRLEEFEQDYPQYEALLTALLRTYGGILDYPAFISENLLARTLKKEEQDIRKELQTITSFGIISYLPQNESPQVILQKNRVPVEEFELKMLPYNKRKKTFIERVESIIAYTKSTACRSRIIAAYFGEENAKDCCICDNCLKRKATELSTEEFESISLLIKEQLSQKHQTATDLFDRIRNIKKEKAWKVLEFLQKEEKIEADGQGILRLKR